MIRLEREAWSKIKHLTRTIAGSLVVLSNRTSSWDFLKSVTQNLSANRIQNKALDPLQPQSRSLAGQPGRGVRAAGQSSCPTLHVSAVLHVRYLLET
jgi:hypothetical protein